MPRDTRRTSDGLPLAPAPLLLGVDVGSTSTKAVVIDGAGLEVARASTPTPFVMRRDRTEMAVDDLRAALETVLAALGDVRRQVASVGFAGMAESGAPFDGGGHPLAPVIAWHDPRGEEAVARLEREFGRDLALRIGQPLRPVLTATKVGWLVAHGAGPVVRWLGVPELCVQALTGAEVTEHSLAARTGCYDVGARRWMPEVPEALGFAVDVFPSVEPAGAVMGHLASGAIRWTGLPDGIPVTIAGHDHLAGMAGAGVGPDGLANSVGTAETIVARLPVPPDLDAALDSRVAISLYPGGREWAALVSTVRAGIVVERVAAALGHAPDKLDRLPGEPVTIDDELLEDLARHRTACLPDGPPGDVWAGLLRAMARRTAEGYGRLTAIAGRRHEMVLFGGGSVSGPWLQAKAALLDIAVRQSVGGTAVARGAAIHAGVAAGWWPAADQGPA